MSVRGADSSSDSLPGIAELMPGNPALMPPVTAVLVGANLLVFVAMLGHGAGLWHSPNHVQLAWGASFGPATKDGEWYRLATAMFLHFGLVHLALNMLALWDAGRYVERLYGPWRFAFLYFASGLAGNLLSLVAQGDRAISGGASGAIFGVYGAFLVCLWRERRQLHPVEFRWLFGGAAIFSAMVIGLGVVVPGIDNAAHIGGLVSGALIGTALGIPLSAASPRPGRARWLAAGAFTAAIAALVPAIPAPDYRWQEELRAREGIRQFLDNDQHIAERWKSILDTGRYGGASFDQLAERIESDVTPEYRDSFEQLSALHLDPAAPSSRYLEILKKYAQIRSEASQSLAEGLRSKDPKRIREALEMTRRAPYDARGVEPPPPPAR